MKEKRKKKKSKKEKKSKRRQSTSSSSSGSESDEWVEQKNKGTDLSVSSNQTPSSREDWMAMTGMIATFSRDDIKTQKQDPDKEKKRIDSYNPATNIRELNPYWRDGGSGLPSTSEKLKSSKPFMRPKNDEEFYGRKHADGKESNRLNYGGKIDEFYGKSDRAKNLKKPIDEDFFSTSRHSRSHKAPVKDEEHNEISITFKHFERPENQDKLHRRQENQRSFKRPSKDSDFYGKSEKKSKKYDNYDQSGKDCETANWKKLNERRTQEEKLETEKKVVQQQTPVAKVVEINETIKNSLDNSDKYMSDEKMNKLAAKIVKAEIMGDTNLVNKLKLKLEEARQYRKDNPDAGKAIEQPEDIMLISTSSRGNARPLTKSSNAGDPRSRGGKRKVETHSAGERMKYFSNDDGHSLSQMFEQEKYSSNYDDDAQLASIAAKHTNPNDDLEDIFTEEISKNVNRGKEDEKNKQRAIKEHMKMEKSLEGCEYCVGSKAMMKHLMVGCGTKVYLALPARKSLTNGHCMITTVQHASCITALDEDVWEEVLNFRKALVNFFNSRNEDVVFFETATRLHKHPHLLVHCVPMPRDVGDSAPIYFKKALLECEAEWSMNKKVVELKGKNIRRGVPKGLPYFWVDFGMDPGFAHIIEDQQLFPNNFAEEIIGGILDLDHQLWKKPQREQPDQLRRKVSEFVQEWKKFDCFQKQNLT